MLTITSQLSLPDEEIELTAIRAQGAGGQNVNKVSSAIHLRFDIRHSSLPAHFKHRLLRLKDRRISAEGILIIKAQQYRSQEMNREDALERLRELIRSVTVVRKHRVPTRPTKAAKEQRLEGKKRLGERKQLRGRVEEY